MCDFLNQADFCIGGSFENSPLGAQNAKNIFNYSPGSTKSEKKPIIIYNTLNKLLCIVYRHNLPIIKNAFR